MVVPAAFVADASFTMPWAFIDEKRSPACDAAWDGLKTSTISIHVPELWLWEVSNALLFGERKGRIAAEESDRFLGILARASIILSHSGASAVFERAPFYMRKHGLTSYDSAYLVLAGRNEMPLATYDKNLRKAAIKEAVGVVS